MYNILQMELAVIEIYHRSTCKPMKSLMCASEAPISNAQKPNLKMVGALYLQFALQF